MRSLIIIALSPGLYTVTASADPLITQAKAAIDADGPVYAYEMAYFDGEVKATGKVDPSQPAGQRITVFTPDQSEWSDEFRESIKSLDAEVDGDIFCDDLAAQIPDDAQRTDEDSESASFAFTPQPDADADKMEKKVMKRIEATATLSKSDGQLLSFQMRLPKPFKPAMVAKINTFEMTARCSRAPDGRTYLQDLQFNISGSAMMQDFKQVTSRRITQLLDPVVVP